MGRSKYDFTKERWYTGKYPGGYDYIKRSLPNIPQYYRVLVESENGLVVHRCKTKTYAGVIRRLNTNAIVTICLGKQIIERHEMGVPIYV